MTDREKVISNFEHEVNKAHGEGWDFVDLSTEDAKEILELLKEQEPVEPRYEMIYGDKAAFCGNCNTYLGSVKYCPFCGKAVKWDD